MRRAEYSRWVDPAPLEVERPRLPWWTMLPRKLLLAAAPLIALAVVVAVAVFLARRVWRYPLFLVGAAVLVGLGAEYSWWTSVGMLATFGVLGGLWAWLHRESFTRTVVRQARSEWRRAVVYAWRWRRVMLFTGLTKRTGHGLHRVHYPKIRRVRADGWRDRTVSLPAFLVPEIEAHLAEFVGRAPDAYVFVGPKGARPARSNFHTVWDKACQRAGVPDLHLHDLRHTGNTLAAETGATLRELMDRMGHRSTRAALIYLHARDHRDQAIADGLDAIVGTAGLGGQPAGSDHGEGHAGGTKQPRTKPKRPQGTDSKPSTRKNARSGRRESNPHGQLGRLGLYH
jgi:hypothetical protein